MKFVLLDEILEQSADRIVAVKRVSPAEEYLADHFPTFPVLPGVLMIETLVQAARRLLARRGDGRLVLGEVRALKFGSMVRPGEALRVEVTLSKAGNDGSYLMKGVGTVQRSGGADKATSGETAVSGRFVMRAIRENPALSPKGS